MVGCAEEEEAPVLRSHLAGRVRRTGRCPPRSSALAVRRRHRMGQRPARVRHRPRGERQPRRRRSPGHHRAPRGLLRPALHLGPHQDPGTLRTDPTVASRPASSCRWDRGSGPPSGCSAPTSTRWGGPPAARSTSWSTAARSRAPHRQPPRPRLLRRRSHLPPARSRPGRLPPRLPRLRHRVGPERITWLGRQLRLPPCHAERSAVGHALGLRPPVLPASQRGRRRPLRRLARTRAPSSRRPCWWTGCGCTGSRGEGGFSGGFRGAGGVVWRFRAPGLGPGHPVELFRHETTSGVDPRVVPGLDTKSRPARLFSGNS